MKFERFMYWFIVIACLCLMFVGVANMLFGVARVVGKEIEFPDEYAQDERIGEIVDLKEKICHTAHAVCCGLNLMRDTARVDLKILWLEHEGLVLALESAWGLAYGDVPFYRERPRYALARDLRSEWGCPFPI